MPLGLVRNKRIDKDSINQKKEEKRWNDLIDAVMDGKVVPVIGSDFLIDDEEDENGNVCTDNLHQQIINAIAAEYGVKSNPKTFSQLVYDKDFLNETSYDRKEIYVIINEILSQTVEANAGNQLRPKRLLTKLLSLQKFPFVITTSFTPVVEMAMREAWPNKDVRVLQFRNDTNYDLKVGKGDIENELDMEQPTVYYMFGKYCDEQRYVVTDLDMMDFCRKWISGGSNVPRVLTAVMKKRYLLVLGNNYSDWLFRFIWYSIRPTADTMRSSMMVHDNIEQSLRDFLNRLQTFIEKDPEFVVSEIERRVNERLAQKNKNNAVQRYETDVFLSYSRRDKEVVKRLYDALSSIGLRVWFDDDSIPPAEDWESKVLKGILNTRLFIPLLSNNVSKEYMEPHEYRVEWSSAASIASKMGGRAFIWPLAENGFDFKNEENKLPDEFQAKNASWYSIADDFSEFALAVKNKVNEIRHKEEELKNGK